jgi:hypothetical protein
MRTKTKRPIERDHRDTAWRECGARPSQFDLPEGMLVIPSGTDRSRDEAIKAAWRGLEAADPDGGCGKR